jgi:hypothetical protein
MEVKQAQVRKVRKVMEALKVAAVIKAVSETVA